MVFIMESTSGFIRIVIKIYDAIMNLFAILAGLLLAFAALSVAAGIATRYIFNYPLPWVTEIAEFILLYLPFLLGVWVLRQDGHVKMDIILNVFPERGRNIFNAVTSTICAVICLVLTIFAVKVMHEQVVDKAFTYTILEIPKWILTIVIVLGSAMLVIEFLRKAYLHMKQAAHSDSQGDPMPAHALNGMEN